jgi:hypothetical protein
MCLTASCSGQVEAKNVSRPYACHAHLHKTRLFRKRRWHPCGWYCERASAPTRWYRHQCGRAEFDYAVMRIPTAATAADTCPNRGGSLVDDTGIVANMKDGATLAALCARTRRTRPNYAKRSSSSCPAATTECLDQTAVCDDGLTTVRRMPKVLRKQQRGLFAGAVIALASALALFTVSDAQQRGESAPPTCSMRLVVEVTPDVDDPSDAGFISSLLGGHPGYQLFLLSVVDDTRVRLQLQGPGPGERCREVVDSISNDGRVAFIRADD